VRAAAYRDAALADGQYQYRIVAEDAEGDSATSATAAITLSSAPEPPSDLAYSWDEETQTLTLIWSASPSADVAAYRVRSSGGAGLLALAAAPVQEAAGLSYEQVFTDETGWFIFLVRAVDGDGKEEASLSQALALYVEDGQLAAAPVEPDRVYAVPAAGGKVEVGWTYRPWRESPPGTGAAFEARVYSDGGAGAVDFDEPAATVAMGSPTAEAEYDWTSGVLEDGGRYLFVVRIATAAWPNGIETQNTAAVGAVAESDVPTTPILTATVV